MQSDSESQEPSLASPRTSTATLPPQTKKQKKSKKTHEVVGPTDIIGRGDCRLIYDILPPTEADTIFGKLKEDTKWQKMYHRSGEVPRLVAVQGQVSENGNEVPIYRHPADETPALLQFDTTVDILRCIAEEHVGHSLNHVLIQWYRSGEDNISEHSDKSLDIVGGSTIVNMSFGAQRTMTIRTKRQVPVTAISSLDPSQEQSQLPKSLTSVKSQPSLEVASRTTQRIPLPHSSLFLLGQATNQHYLHAIRADKRPVSEKLPVELAFNGERISLTFRHIGTFINTDLRMIYGQGATGKSREKAMPILRGEEAEKEGEKMIKAFGVENHYSSEWAWDEWYGRGFDVMDFDRHELKEDAEE